ncbi:hypothetical protein Q4610_18650 [Sphingobium sp. HBC34]|uniref:Uncharacterized protein n=1 Tax=Sphingobium cyanobacteriorum TaxID=3063954 RepID=A0ABT8ZSJ8_9SPHN|nr:hypothetical protein [Sphingobium sp. HBC34]MDO7837068.1 hypothetical protein [Sphingobium sp. HBC34]
MSDDGMSPAMATLRQVLAIKVIDPVLHDADEATRLACWMLAATQPWPVEACATMEALYVAHRDVAQDAGVWRNLRRAAVGLGESEDAMVRAFGAVAEAAAWPLSTSQAGLVELMQAICQLRASQASVNTGWTQADEEKANAAFHAIVGDNEGTAPAREEIPGLFRVAEPELERRFAMNLQAFNLAYIGFRSEVAAWVAGASR